MHFLRADKNNITELVKIRLDYLIEDYGKIEDDVLNKIKSSLPDYYEQHLSKDFFAYIAKDDDKVVSSAFLFPRVLIFIFHFLHNKTIFNFRNIFFIREFINSHLRTTCKKQHSNGQF